MCEQIPCSQ
jgi:hypothetical protein